MILDELMKRVRPIVATERDRVSQCAELMQGHRVGSVIIVDDDHKVVGILTDRDIGLSLGLGAASPDSFVSEIMTRGVETIPASITIYELTHKFRGANVKRFPVVDKQQKLVGVVSSDDVIALLAREMFDTCQSLEPKLGHMV